MTHSQSHWRQGGGERTGEENDPILVQLPHKSRNNRGDHTSHGRDRAHPAHHHSWIRGSEARQEEDQKKGTLFTLFETVKDLRKDDDGEGLVNGEAKRNEPDTNAKAGQSHPTQLPVKNNSKTNGDKGREEWKEDPLVLVKHHDEAKDSHRDEGVEG